MKKNYVYIILFTAVSSFFIGCTNPQNVSVDLKKSEVFQQKSNYTTSLDVFGKMTEIYASNSARIQSKGVTDDTGTSQATGGEIPIDVTEMIKSSINKIGGKIQYIDYDPSHMSNMRALGYSNFQNKIIPNLVVSGGITEFDRSLEVQGKGSDAGVSGTVNGNSYGLDMGSTEKSAKANITVDISLIDFQTWAMIPKMTTTNTVSVYSGTASSELGFSILASTFGLNGNVKNVQGRHAAVRILIELSIIQVVGRHLDLPYWKILPNGKEDKVVINSISRKFMKASGKNRIGMIQNSLYLHGYDVELTGKLDSSTKAAIDRYKLKNASSVAGYDTLVLFRELYLNIPIDGNFRSTNVFKTFSSPPKVKKAVSSKVKVAPVVLKTSKVPMKKAKPIVVKGTFVSQNETMAINMATNMALNSLAKRFGKVVQSEYSSFMNNDVMMEITTNARNIVSGYEVVSEDYDHRSGKATVKIKLDGDIIDAAIQEKLK